MRTHLSMSHHELCNIGYNYLFNAFTYSKKVIQRRVETNTRIKKLNTLLLMKNLSKHEFLNVLCEIKLNMFE